MSSILKVTCISAQLTRDTQMFSNMDPYVLVYCGSQKRKTRTHNQGGKRPLWNDSFSFANPKSQQLKFAVWDEDTVTDDLVGQGVLDITKFTSSPNIPAKQYVSLNYLNKPSGKLYVQITYQSNNTPNNNFGGNNNINTWGNNNSNSSQGNTNNTNTWGNNNANSGWGNNITQPQQGIQAWNTQNNVNGWGNGQNITQPQQSQGWGSNNVQPIQPGSNWGNQNNNNNIQGQGGFNPQQIGQAIWTASNNNNKPPQNTNNINNNFTNPNNFGYQQQQAQQLPGTNLQKKGSNYEVNPYGNTSNDNNTNPYPALNDNANKTIENPLNMVIGAKLFGQKQPVSQQPINAFNILDMAVLGKMQQQPQQNNSGWGQPQYSPQNPSWGQQPNQNNSKPSGWGNNGW